MGGCPPAFYCSRPGANADPVPLVLGVAELSQSLVIFHSENLPSTHIDAHTQTRHMAVTFFKADPGALAEYITFWLETRMEVLVSGW